MLFHPREEQQGPRIPATVVDGDVHARLIQGHDASAKCQLVQNSLTTWHKAGVNVPDEFPYFAISND
jgi:hypothetical protein